MTKRNPIIVKYNIKIEDLEEVKSTTTVKIGEFFKHTGNVLMLKSKVDELKKKEPSTRKRKGRGSFTASAWEGRSQYYLILADRQRNIVTCDPKAIKEHIETTWPKLEKAENPTEEMLSLYQYVQHPMLFFFKYLQALMKKSTDGQSIVTKKRTLKKQHEQPIELESSKSLAQFENHQAYLERVRSNNLLKKDIKALEEKKSKLLQEIAKLEAFERLESSKDEDEPRPCKKVNKEGDSFNNNPEIYSPASNRSSFSAFWSSDQVKKPQGDYNSYLGFSNSSPRIESFGHDSAFFPHVAEVDEGQAEILDNLEQQSRVSRPFC